MISLLIAALLAGTPSHAECRGRGRGCSSDKALDRFLPLSGAGWSGAECDGTAFTSKKGASVTFTRASSAYCTKSDGTMVLLTSDKPRVSMVGGQPMLPVEGSATNLVTRSSELNNVAWTKEAGCAVTADQGVAPDGTTSMDLTTNATVPANFAYQTIVFSGTATITLSGYTKATAGTNNATLGSTCLGGGTTSGCSCTVSSGTCTTYTLSATVNCGAYTSITTTAKRMTLTHTCTGTANYTAGYAGGTNVATGAALWWGTQVEQSSFATSYIATTGTSATRGAESPSTSKPSGVTNTAGCMAADLYWNGSDPVNQRWFLAWTNGTRGAFINASNASSTLYDGTGATVALTAPTGRVVPFKGTWVTSGNKVNTTDGSSTSNSFSGDMLASSTTLYIGQANGSAPFNGYIGNIRLGNTTTGCDK